MKYKTLTDLRKIAKDDGIKAPQRKTEPQLIELLKDKGVEVVKIDDTVKAEPEVKTVKEEPKAKVAVEVDGTDQIADKTREIESLKAQLEIATKEYHALIKAQVASPRKSLIELLKESRAHNVNSPAIKKAIEMRSMQRAIMPSILPNSTT